MFLKKSLKFVQSLVQIVMKPRQLWQHSCNIKTTKKVSDLSAELQSKIIIKLFISKYFARISEQFN